MKAFSLALALGAVLAVGVASASERSDLLVAKGHVAYQAGNWDEARGIFAEAAAADPADAAAQYGLGLAYGRLGRWDESADAFQRALTLVPDFPEAKRGLQIASSARDQRGGGQETTVETGR